MTLSSYDIINMSKRFFYVNQIELDKRFSNLLDMDSFFRRTSRKCGNFKNLNKSNLNELNETFF